MTTPKIPTLLKAARKQLGLTQNEFANLIGVSFPTINRWENAKTSPSSLAIGKITQVLWTSGEVTRDIWEQFQNYAQRDKKQLQKEIKTIGLFAGCGGLDLGFHQAGFNITWANEINKWAADTYEENFPDTTVDRRDIIEVDPYSDKSIPECDIILGGFPCQDFSIIWKRPGLNSDRGNLYKNFLRFVDAKKPKAFIAENVRGLLSANKRLAIQQIIKDFASIDPGYVVSIKLFNFADYGVPQFRERVIIVGIRHDTGFDFSFPLPTHGPLANAPYYTAGEALEGVEGVPYNTEHMNIAPRTVEILKLIPEGGNFSDIPVDSPYYVKGMISHVYRRINLSEPSKTLIASGGGGTWGYHYPEPRALTNRERARLQSFPDSFIFEGSFGEIRRQIGNAVPPLAALHLAKTLLPLYTSNYERIDLRDRNDFLSTLPITARIQKDTSEWLLQHRS